MAKVDSKDMGLLNTEGDNVVLFHPYIPKKAIEGIGQTLETRWIGQGPKVDLFEDRFSHRFAKGYASIATGSCTDSLHLAYLLAGIRKDDEVVAPVFTCTATNIPFHYIGAKVKFADVQPDSLNIDPSHVKRLVDHKTKAIVCVHYGGLPCDMNELRSIADYWGIPIIEDAAQALGGTYQKKTIGSISEFTAFSFQAIKHITTGDGGMLTIKDEALTDKAKRLRWFGIDRSAKQKGTWENDIKEVGYKYQMTDIAASMGLAGLDDFEKILAHRQKILSIYEEELASVPGIKVIGANYRDREHAAWICTVIVEKRWDLQKKLRDNHIESNQVHYRNDRYSVFGGRRDDLPNMDALEDKYLVLPLHMNVSEADVRRICKVIKSGW